MKDSDKNYMKRAIFLAQKGRFSVSPNPRVGAVIVHKNTIIGEGYHAKFGEAHAEVNAIKSIKNKSLLQDSCIYINLEPCSHFGKTPPCTDLILKYKIPKVVIANTDPFSKVAGSGIKKLKSEGVSVITGVLEKEAAALNKRFFTFHQEKRPYIILKWAETADGFIGRDQSDPNKADSWITSPLSKQLVHLWRAEEDSILVGKNTALIDNPELNCRAVKGQNPTRLLIDQNLEVPQHFNIFNTAAKTIIFNALKKEKIANLKFVKIDFKNKESVVKSIVNLLHEENIQSLIVEGGRETLQTFINLKLWDEARVFSANKYFKKGIKAPTGVSHMLKKENIDTDTLTYYGQV